jgi:hypothetical protein
MAGHLALMVAFDSLFCDAQLLLRNLRLYPQIRQFIPKSLCFYAQRLSLLLPNLDLFLQHDTAFDGYVVLGLDVLE